jgi:hypothetical protein
MRQAVLLLSAHNTPSIHAIGEILEALLALFLPWLGTSLSENVMV